MFLVVHVLSLGIAKESALLAANRLYSEQRGKRRVLSPAYFAFVFANLKEGNL